MKDVELKTERLVIKTSKRKDIPAMFEIIKNNYDLTQYMCWEPPQKISESYETWDQNIKKYSKDIFLTIFYQSKFAGRITIRDLDPQDKSADFGFWIAPHFQGQGFGSEALNEIARFVFEDLKMERLTGGAFSQNEASQKVQTKIGFKFTKLVINKYEKRGIQHDGIEYELLAKDFLNAD